MKKLLLLLSLSLIIVSCSTECDQEALCRFIKTGGFYKSQKQSSDKVFICHKGSTLEINIKSLQDHLDHGDTKGQCRVLSSDGLVFIDKEIVTISCDHDLPFIYIKDNGEQWLYSKPY